MKIEFEEKEAKTKWKVKQKKTEQGLFFTNLFCGSIEFFGVKDSVLHVLV